MLNPIRYVNSCFDKISGDGLVMLGVVPFVGPLAAIWKTHLLYKEINPCIYIPDPEAPKEIGQRFGRAVGSFAHVHGLRWFTTAIHVGMFVILSLFAPVTAAIGGALTIAAAAQFLYVSRRITVLTHGAVTVEHGFWGDYKITGRILQ